jgi:short-subunit dehydrogenase
MKWAVITGASAGLGVEFAKLCAKDGFSLILVARRKERMDELANELTQKHTNIQIKVIAQDLAKAGAAQTLHEKVMAITHDIDVLINNAGFGAVGNFPKPDLARQMEMIDLNVRTLVELTGLFLPRMLTRKMGRILNVGSLAGFQPGPYMSIYYATKAFVNSFTEALHEELGDSGVTCTLLAPGPVHTEFGQVAKTDTSRLFKRQTVVEAKAVAECGYKAMREGKDIAIPGFSAKMVPQILRFTPRALVRKTASWLNRSVQ